MTIGLLNFANMLVTKTMVRKKRICGLSESWHDKQTAAMAFADRRLASCGSFDRNFAASDLLCDLVWDAGSFFTA